MSANGNGWVLVNGSPDIRFQVESFPPLQARAGVRDTSIVAVVLVDGQIDHTAGLLILREGSPLALYCTDSVAADLSGPLPLLEVLGHYCGVNRHPIPTDGAGFTVAGATGLRFTAVPLSGKAPPYSPHRHAPREGDTIGLEVEDTTTGGRLFYAPGIARIDPHLRPFLERADCLLIDGTFWQDDEMIRLGLGQKRAQDMGHLPQSGPNGMIEQLRPSTRARKILIHVNNSNPILDEASTERALLARERIEVAYDGMDIQL